MKEKASASTRGLEAVGGLPDPLEIWPNSSSEMSCSTPAYSCSSARYPALRSSAIEARAPSVGTARSEAPWKAATGGNVDGRGPELSAADG
jgi:hypothetical protein